MPKACTPLQQIPSVLLSQIIQVELRTDSLLEISPFDTECYTCQFNRRVSKFSATQLTLMTDKANAYSREEVASLLDWDMLAAFGLIPR